MPQEGASPWRSRNLSRMASAVRQQVADANLSGSSIVVAVSGGADSLALLHLLHHIRDACRLTLHVAHVDHGLRPASPEDAAFVAGQAKALGLPCTIRAVDVATRRKSRKLSLEQAARELRYETLAEVAGTVGAAWVATGHTAEDQAETVLLHILRGSGLHGLQGMSAVGAHRMRSGASVMLFRPLLTLTRADTEACCSALALQPRQDVTNADVAYTRNFVRHRIMPVLGEVNPAVQDALLRLSRSATLEEDYLERQAEAAWPGLARVAASSVTFSRQRLAAEHPALRRVLLRRAHVALQGDAIDLEEAHLAAMDGLLEGPAGRSVALPNGLTWSVSYRTAMLAKSTARQASPLPPLSGAHLLACPGVTRIGGWRVRVEYVPPAPSTEGPYTAVLDAEAIGDQPVVRTRKEGDRFWPLGLPQAEGKRLKEFLSDAQVPRAWRDRVPLVEAPRGVAWVVGWQIAHWARITPASTRGLRITFQRAGATETDDGASKE